MTKKKIQNLLINKDCSIKRAMRVIDREGLGMALVVGRSKKLFGLVTDGDVRRAILAGVNINRKVEEIANKNPIVVARPNELKSPKIQERLKEKMIVGGSLKVPVVNRQRGVEDIIFIYGPGEEKPAKSQAGIKNVLLTGGAGYLGSILCRKLLERGYRVRVLDNLTYGGEGIKDLYDNKNFKLFKGDIRNIAQATEALKGADAVIHLAAIVGDPASQLNPKQTIEINYLATKALAEACKYFQINRFLFASSCSVYGESPSPNMKLTEESPLNPVSLYAETKINCEKAILEGGVADENFSPIILRMATLYGQSPAMRFDLALNFFTAKAIFDKKITIFGGKQWRPWLDVEDAARAFMFCLEAPIEKVRGEIFNVLSENHRVIEVGKIINSICPEAELEVNKKITDNRSYNVSAAKISQVLNYQPKKKIADGIIGMKKAIKNGLVKNYRDPRYRISLPQI